MATPTTYLALTDISVLRFLERQIAGHVTMLNLFRCRVWADDPEFPDDR